MAMKLFKAPPLPKAPEEYHPEYTRQVLRILSIYFSQLDSFTPRQAESYTADTFYGSIVGTTSPGNTFVSSVDQVAPSLVVANVVTFTGSLFTDNVHLVAGTKITPTYPGIYRFDYALQINNPNANTEIVDVWFRKNGVDVPDSNNKYGIAARKSAGVPAIFSSSADFFIQIAAGDYVEIVWHPSDILVFLDAIPASLGPPAIPATAAVACNVAFISLASL